MDGRDIMQIIELEEKQFRNYAKVHSKRNIYQTVEYAEMQRKHGFKPMYLGFMDECENVVAATVILEAQSKKKHKFGIAPGGFLIDFKNIKLLQDFTIALKTYLEKKKFVYVRLNPLLGIKRYNSKGKLIRDNTKLLEEYKRIGYHYDGFEENKFDSNVIMYAKDDAETTYKSFKRMMRRKIDEQMHMGINVYRGNEEDIALFYEMIKNKDKRGIDYYKELYNFFNTDDMKMDIYLAKMEPKVYINNYRYLLKKEMVVNDTLASQIKAPKVKKTRSLIRKKMTSDRLIAKYDKTIKKATEIYKKYPDGIIISSCAIICNNKEVFILNTGYEKKLKDVYSSELMIWEIIKKYMKDNYRIFNLGCVPNNISKKSKNYNVYYSKMGYNGEVITYPGKFDLVIRGFLYKVTKKKNK